MATNEMTSEQKKHWGEEWLKSSPKERRSIEKRLGKTRSTLWNWSRGIKLNPVGRPQIMTLD